MRRLTWVVAAIAILVLVDNVRQRSQRKKAEDFANKTAATLTLMSRVNEKAFTALDECRETNDALTTRGQAMLRNLFSADAAKLQEVGRGWRKQQEAKRLFASNPQGMPLEP